MASGGEWWRVARWNACCGNDEFIGRYCEKVCSVLTIVTVIAALVKVLQGMVLS